MSSPATSPAGSAAVGPAAEDLAVASIDTVPSPCELAEGLGRVWISSYARNEVVGIDPATNEVVTTLAVPDGPCSMTRRRFQFRVGERGDPEPVVLT